MHRIDGEGATADNKFTEGNPSTGLVATEVTADWLTSIQEEIANVIEAAGVTLDKPKADQLLEAIMSLIAGGGSAVVAGAVEIEDAGEYFSGGEVEAALQQLGAKIYAGTFSSNQIRRSSFGLSGSAQTTNANQAEAFVGLLNATPITYTIQPDSALDLPLGTSITLCQTGAGQVTVAPGVGVTLSHSASFNPKTLNRDAIIVLVKSAPNSWRLGGMLEAA